MYLTSGVQEQVGDLSRCQETYLFELERFCEVQGYVHLADVYCQSCAGINQGNLKRKWTFYLVGRSQIVKCLRTQNNYEFTYNEHPTRSIRRFISSRFICIKSLTTVLFATISFAMSIYLQGTIF